MDKCIMILPGTPLSVINNILALSNNNAAKKINDCIKALIDTLNKKGFDTLSRYSNLLKKLPKDKIQEEHIKVINKLIDELILFYKTKNNKSIFDKNNTGKQKAKKNKQKMSDWDASKVDGELILSYIEFINTITSSDCVKSCPLNQKVEREDAIRSILKLLKMQDFQNQIFAGGDNQEKLILKYISTLLNVSQAKVFEFMTKDNKNMFVQILDSLLNQKKLSEKVFCGDNVGNDGIIHQYIDILKNLAYLITPKKSEYNDVAKSNIRQQIDTNDVKFLIKSLNKFVTDETLIRLVFNGENNQKTIESFFDALFNLACHTNYLENNGCFHDISDLLCVLKSLLGDRFKKLFVVPKFCHKFLLCYGEIFEHSNTFKDDQKKKLSDMLNTTLLSDEWSKIILENKGFSDFYLIILESFLDRNKNLVDCKSVINVMYNFYNDKNIQQMSDQNIDVKICLFMLEDAIERYIHVEDKNSNLTFEKIVCILNNIQSKDYKFKEQIFYKNEIGELINDDAKDTSNKKMFDNKMSKHKNSIARLYTSMLKNVSQLSNKKNIDIKHKQAFFSLIKDVLIKKEYEYIRKMIFSGEENGPQGAICNFIQVFYNLLSDNNLKELNEGDKKNWIQLFLFFIRDEELQYQIFQLGNDGKNGAVDFYFRTLFNILHLKNTQFTNENKKAVANLIQNLENKYLKAKRDFDKCVYYEKIIKVEQALGIQKTTNNKEQKKLTLLKFARDMFETKKDLNTSNSMPDLLLPSQKLKISKSKNKLTLPTKDSKHKDKFTNKPKDVSDSTKMLNTSKSMGNLFKINKMFSNKSLNLNLNTFKPQVNKINQKINSIKINSTAQNKKNLFDPQKKLTEKPNMLDKNESDKNKGF